MYITLIYLFVFVVIVISDLNQDQNEKKNESEMEQKWHDLAMWKVFAKFLFVFHVIYIYVIFKRALKKII